MLADSNPGVEYVNLIDDPRFTPEDFFDSDHLNGRGAEKLSRLLDQLLFAHRN